LPHDDEHIPAVAHSSSSICFTAALALGFFSEAAWPMEANAAAFSAE